MRANKDDEALRPCLLLAAYEMGLLEPAERIRFEEHLGECDTCPGELYAMSAPMEALLSGRARGAEGWAAAPARARRRDVARRRAATGTTLAERLRGLLPRPVWVPAAALVVATLAVVLLVRPFAPRELRDLARVSPVPYELIEWRDGTEGPADLLFHRGMERYTQGRHAEAAGLLRDCLREAEAIPRWRRADEARFFLGLNLLLAGSPDSACAVLEQAESSRNAVLRDRSRWYAAQALLLQGDARAALPRLEALADSSAIYGEEARAQLEAVRRMMQRRGG